MGKIKEIQSQITELKKQMREAAEEYWEALYKKRCPKYFISYDMFIHQIGFWNDDFTSESRKKVDEFKDKCYYKLYDDERAIIPEILTQAEYYNFKIPLDVANMICEACACNSCPYLEEHLGYTCEECRFNKHYTGYQGYCDE